MSQILWRVLYNLFIIFTLFTGPLIDQARGGAFEVSPIRLNLDPSKSATVLHISNKGQELAVVQMDLMQWTQINGEDVYQKSQDVLAVPMIARIKPGVRQIIRLALRRPPNEDNEKAYRLFIRELPDARSTQTGVKIVLTLSVPVFVAPKQTAKSEVHWTAKALPNGQYKLTLFNKGNIHVRLSQIKAYAANNESNASTQKILAYVLPGQQQSWTLKLKTSNPATPIKIVTTINDQELSSNATMEK